jgi:FAD/FMN-containing dehydrogenase
VRVDARFEGIAAGVDAQFAQFATYAAGAQPAASPADAWKRETLWEGREPPMVLKFSVQPTQIADLCKHVQQSCASTNMQWSIVAHGIGLGWLRLSVETPVRASQCADILKTIRSYVDPLGGSVVVLHCPPEARTQFDMWGDAGDALALMRRIKSQFDPEPGPIRRGHLSGGVRSQSGEQRV